MDELKARPATAQANSFTPFASVDDAATAGKAAIDNLREHVASINGHAAHLDPRNLKQLADLFGQEWANDYRTRLEGSRAGAVELLGVKQQQIGDRFEVIGSLTLREPDGSYTIGAFALEARAGNGLARIGSDGSRDRDTAAAQAQPKPAQPGSASAGPLNLRV